MSTQNRNTGGGGRSHKKANTVSGSGVGGGDISGQVAAKKTDATKTEKEKVPPKPTAEQLRIAQITNSNTIEDPQMREKVATLIETTQRSEEEVCCALYECDYNLERAVVFLLETLPVGAFETSSKKKKNKVATTGTPDGGAGDGEWTTDTNANTDKREKSRNRSSNRGGRGGTDSRGWRGREARENDRNARESRGGDRERGGERDRDRDDRNEAYRSGPRGGGRRDGGGRGGYGGRGGRGGGNRMSGGRGPGAGRSGGSYSSRLNANDEHQEVELWDNTIAQNAEKQSQSQDDTWGDWDNEEYVGSLKEGKVFTSSNLPNQTVASVVSGGIGGNASERAAPPGLEQHLGSVGLGGSSSSGSSQQPLSSLVSGGVSGLNDEQPSVTATTPATGMMQYSAAVTSSQVPPQQPAQSAGQPSTVVAQQPPPSTQPPQQSPVAHSLSGSATYNSGGAAVDAFANAATAAANLVQQAQQQPQIKSSATLSAEQSQYFNSLSSQNTGGTAPVAGSNVQQMPSYAQQTTGGSVQYPSTYANVFGSGVANAVAVPGAASNGATDSIQMPSGPQPRRARAKLPPPSKIPSSAVEMPGDSLNNIGYLDVQFGALDFGPDESFDSISDKFNSGVTVDAQAQQTQQQTAPPQQDVPNEFQSKNAGVQQPPQQVSLAATLQNAQLGDSLTTAYSQRSSQQQVVGGGGGASSSGSSTLDQLAKAADQYNQSGGSNTSSYQNAYQVAGAKSTNAYQQAPPVQGYTTSYANVQSSVANAYQGQSYGSYQQNSVNSYQQQQQQQQTGVVGGTGPTGGGVANSVSSSSGGVSSSSSSATVNSTQNIPGGSNSSTASNPSSAYLSSGYTSQPSAYQSTQSVYHSSSLNSTGGFTGSTNTSSSQYSNFSASAKLKENATTSSNSHFDNSVTANTSAGSNSGPSVSSVTSVAVNASSSTNANNSGSGVNANASVVNSVANSTNSSNSSSNATGNSNTNATSAVSGGSGSSGAAVGVSTGTGNVSGNASSVATAATAGGSSSVSSGSSSNKNSAGGMVPNIQMVSQYIQTGLPYYQQPVYSYEEIQMMQQRVPHVQGYYDLNYTNTSLGAGRDNLGSVAYSAMADGRFTRTDNNSSPVGNVSSTMSQQAGSGGPMLNVPYYFYSGNVMPGSFQYGTPAIYPPQIPAANSASGGQFPKPSYNTGYNSASYDALSQATQEYSKGAYQSSVTQQAKSQNSTNAPQTGSGSDITSSMYGKGHVALNKVNSYEKQNFHSGTPPPFNMANTQTAGGTSAQPYGMYLPMPAGGHHNMIHQPIHQDSNSTGQRQQTSSQSKTGTKQGYSPSYWTGQN